MKDNGLVISTKRGLAQVEVQCLIESCQKCTARGMCIGNNRSKGLLTVKNPLKACSGDEVKIEIPDAKYCKALILLFGSLLIASLVGLGGGYLLSVLVPFSSSATSLIGLLLAISIAGVFLSLYFKGRYRNNLYPVIIDIIKKGDCHG